MTFLNKKEQVLDIELTQHGKRLLSRGKLKPVYYAFFDDNVIYDSKYGGFEENRNDAGQRIKDDTPTTEVQYVFSGIETDIKKAVAQKRTNISAGLDEGVMIQGTPEKHYTISAPLGNSGQGDIFSPSWGVNVFQGEISGTIEVVTGSQPNTKIPQINLENVVFKTTPITPIKDSPEAQQNQPFGDFGDAATATVSDLNFASSRFEDGSFIQIEEDFILLEVSEENVDNLSKNFDIEVFIQEVDDITGQDVFTPLYFDVKKPLVINDILVDQDDDLPLENRALDPTYVDHFFHVYVDDEISKDVLCRKVPLSVLEASFPADFIDCDKFIEPRLANNTLVIDAGGLYDSDVTEADIDPDCD